MPNLVGELLHEALVAWDLIESFIFEDPVDQIRLFVAVRTEHNKQDNVLEDPQLFDGIVADDGRLVDGTVVTANVQVSALVLVQFDHVLVISEFQILESNKKFCPIPNDQNSEKISGSPHDILY